MTRQLQAEEGGGKKKKKAGGVVEGGGRARDTMESCAQKMRHRGKQKGATSQAQACLKRVGHGVGGGGSKALILELTLSAHKPITDHFSENMEICGKT